MSAIGITCSMRNRRRDQSKPLSFSPTGRCPTYEVPEAIAGPATEKSRNDDYQYSAARQS